MKRNRRARWVLRVAVAALLLASAAAQAAIVIALRGEASVQRGQQTITLREGATLEDSDELVTSPGAEVLVQFDDEARMVVRSESRVEFKQLLRKEELQRQQKINVAKGALRYLSGALTDRKQVVFTSPHATIGIRGTDIEILMGPAPAGANPPGTYLKVNTGLAVLTGLDGTSIELTPGEVALALEAELSRAGVRSIRRPSARKVEVVPADLFRAGALDSLLR